MKKRMLGSPGYPKRDSILLAALMFLMLIVVATLNRMHYLARTAFGPEFAVIIVAALVAWISLVFSLGLRLGSYVEWSVCRRTLKCNSPPKPGSLFDWFIKIWGHTVDVEGSPEKAPDEDELPSGITMSDVDELLEIAGKRRGGKKSPYPDDVRYRAVRDWINMQANGTSVTLQQFLDERFGSAAETGMPLVPNQTFYTWRKKFIKELLALRESKARKK